VREVALLNACLKATASAPPATASTAAETFAADALDLGKAGEFDMMSMSSVGPSAAKEAIRCSSEDSARPRPASLEQFPLAAGTDDEQGEEEEGDSASGVPQVAPALVAVQSGQDDQGSRGRHDSLDQTEDEVWTHVENGCNSPLPMVDVSAADAISQELLEELYHEGGANKAPELFQISAASIAEACMQSGLARAGLHAASAGAASRAADPSKPGTTDTSSRGTPDNYTPAPPSEPRPAKRRPSGASSWGRPRSPRTPGSPWSARSPWSPSKKNTWNLKDIPLPSPSHAAPPSPLQAILVNLKPSSERSSSAMSSVEDSNSSCWQPDAGDLGKKKKAAAAVPSEADRDEEWIKEQARLRQRFLQNMRSTKAKDGKMAERSARLEEYHRVARKVHQQHKRKEQEKAWAARAAGIKAKADARREGVLTKTEQELQLQYGRMYLAPPLHIKAQAADILRKSAKAERIAAAKKNREVEEKDEAAGLEAFLLNYAEALGRSTSKPETIWEMKTRLRLEARSNPNAVEAAETQGKEPNTPTTQRPPASPRGVPARRASMSENRGVPAGLQRKSIVKEDIADDSDSLSSSDDESEAEAPGSAQGRMSMRMSPVSMKGFDELRSFLEEREGAALVAWIKHFDVNGDLRVSREEFLAGLLQCGWTKSSPEQMLKLFDSLDIDGDGELALEEIDKGQAMLWQEFRHWCTSRYEDLDDLLNKLIGGRDARIAGDDFSEALLKEGWKKGCESLIFASLDVQGDGEIGEFHFRWFLVDKRRARMKEKAQQANIAEQGRRVNQKMAAQSRLMNFKLFLKNKYGSFVRAWRCALTPNDALVIYKHHFMKACAKLGWQGDPRSLWNAFDKDDSGSATIDELDFQSARTLAQFKQWVVDNFGTTENAFAAIDVDGQKKVKAEEFATSLVALGFKNHTKQLFHGLDKDGKKCLVEADLAFLDRWRPLPFLLADKNEQAAAEVKEILLAKYRNFLTAWRQLLDKDGANRCNWFEFHQAAEKLGYKGDLAGAWRSLDSDASGYITLREFDPASSEILLNFRKWSDEEFGGVRSAFSAFDVDGSNDISRAEFRQACRIFGFRGDAGRLFTALDVSNQGRLTSANLAFLDGWERQEDPAQLQAMMQEHRRKSGVAGRRASNAGLGLDGPIHIDGLSPPSTPPPGKRPSQSSITSIDLKFTRQTSAVSGEVAQAVPGKLIGQQRRGALLEKNGNSAVAAAANLGSKNKAVPPGLAAWQSRRNPWHWPRKGSLPPMNTVVETLLAGRPPPEGGLQPTRGPSASLTPRQAGGDPQLKVDPSARSKQRTPPPVPLPVNQQPCCL